MRNKNRMLDSVLSAAESSHRLLLKQQVTPKLYAQKSLVYVQSWSRSRTRSRFSLSGFYEPRYGFETSEEYVDRLSAIRDEQKAMIREKAATVCPKGWVVDGSLAKGRQMMAEHSQLLLRAFNGDCDAAISRVKYDNVARVEKRIGKALRGYQQTRSDEENRYCRRVS